MNPLAHLMVAFNAAKPQTKAGWVAALCGAFGVFGGFVLYVVFTHMFEHGEGPAKIAGIGGGLLASVIVAWFGHRLWETIDEGQVTLGWYSRRTLIAVIALVAVFELSASAFEDFVRALSGDFASIRRIAADIAGRDNDDGSNIVDDAGAADLLQLMREQIASAPVNCFECVKLPAMRLVAILPEAARLRIFATELKLTDEQIYAAFIDPSKHFGRSGGDSCAPPLAVGSRAARLVAGLPDSAADNVGQIKACRELLFAKDDAPRRVQLTNALRDILGRHDLYDADSFLLTLEKGHDTERQKEPLELGGRLKSHLADQRKQCDGIEKGALGAASWGGCLTLVQSGKATAGSGRLEPVSDMRAANRELLAAAFPGIVKPQPVYWWDLIVLFLIWSTAAVVLGVYLTVIVFEGAGELDGVKGTLMRVGTALGAVALSAVLAGVVLVLTRFIPFAWGLMFDPSSVSIAAPVPMLAIIPWLVQWLAGGGIGFAIPGWITLPVFVILALVVWDRQGKPGDVAPRVAGFALAGFLLTSVIPVLGGVAGVLLIVAGAWLVPSLGLTLMLPYLKPGRSLPLWWGTVAMLGGLAVALWVWTFSNDADALYRWTTALGGLLAAVTGIFILQRVTVAELWPLLALTIGLALVGGVKTLQQLTFAGALKELHPVSHTTMSNNAPSELDVLYYLRVVKPQLDAEKIPEEFQAKATNEDLDEALHLELALTGSIGFWLTIAVLVAWSLKQGPHAVDTPDPARATAPPLTQA